MTQLPNTKPLYSSNTLIDSLALQALLSSSRHNKTCKVSIQVKLYRLDCRLPRDKPKLLSRLSLNKTKIASYLIQVKFHLQTYKDYKKR